MLTNFINTLLVNNISEYTVLVLLYLPIVATLVTFSRYIIGWRSLSIYATVLLVFALYDLARTPLGTVDIADGLIQGGIITLTVTFVTTLLHSATREMRFHYIAKVSMIMGFLTLVVFALLRLAVEIDYDFGRLSPMAILIMVVVLDVFVKTYIRKGQNKAFLLILNTIGIAFLIFAIIAQPVVRDMVLAHPEISLYTIVINVFLGQWRHLRLTEYLRFKDIDMRETHDTQNDS